MARLYFLSFFHLISHLNVSFPISSPLHIPPKIMRPHPLSLPPQRPKARVLSRTLITLITLDAYSGSSQTDADAEDGVGESKRGVLELSVRVVGLRRMCGRGVDGSYVLADEVRLDD